MLELGTFGSVRGVSGNGHPYRNPRSRVGFRRPDLAAVDLLIKRRPTIAK